ERDPERERQESETQGRASRRRNRRGPLYLGDCIAHIRRSSLARRSSMKRIRRAASYKEQGNKETRKQGRTGQSSLEKTDCLVPNSVFCACAPFPVSRRATILRIAHA